MDRLPKLTRRVVDEAATAIRAGVCRIDRDRLTVIGDRLLILALVIIQPAAGVVRQGALGIEPDGLGQVGKGLVIVGGPLLRILFFIAAIARFRAAEVRSARRRYASASAGAC